MDFLYYIWGIKMGRKRKYSINLWFSEKEFIELRDNISKTYLSRSDYIRKCALGKDITVIPGIRDLMVDLREISNYLGELTHKVNSGDLTFLGDNLKEIKEDLRDVWAKLSKVLKKI